MLGLATHEPNFTIVREEFVYGKPKPCPLCGQPGCELIDCTGLPPGAEDKEPPVYSKGNYIFIRFVKSRAPSSLKHWNHKCSGESLMMPNQ